VPAQPRRSLGRIFLFAAALFVGIVGGLNATSYALDNKRPANEPPMPEAALSRDDGGLPATSVVRETMPTEPVADRDDDVEPIEQAPVAETPPKEATVQRPKVIRPPRPHVTKPPQPRRHVPVQAPQQDDDEDLYDAR
jgi:hypothetical protein